MTVVPVGRRSYAPRMSREDRREQLMKATLHIINTRGVGAVTMDAVAKAVGVTRPVVYDQFKDGNELLMTVLDHVYQKGLIQIASIMPLLQQEGHPHEVMMRALDAFIRTIQSDPETWSFTLMPVNGVPAEVAERIGVGRSLVVSQIGAFLMRSRDSRHTHSDIDIELLSNILFGSLMEVARQALANPEKYTPERLVGTVSALVSVYFTD